MKRSVVVSCLFVLLAALVSAVALAWPAFFDLNPPGIGAPPSLSGWECISQPYVNPLFDAGELMDDINAVAGGPVTTQVCRWLTTVDGFSCYTGTTGAPFPLEAGPGYLVRVSGPAAIPYVIAGGDVPLFPLMLDGPGPTSASGTHLISIPEVDIPVPLADAGDVLALLGPPAESVCRFAREANAFLCYTGTAGAAFPLVDGEAYLVQVDAPVVVMMP
ncbi:MAG TPA: hypothetical protein VD788_13970 [Candidatus Polarisedimenticolaceae bacterium]|nr:hypothetical protein [Candidatus Polarisedimenticolaceae bacterium]